MLRAPDKKTATYDTWLNRCDLSKSILFLNFQQSKAFPLMGSACSQLLERRPGDIDPSITHVLPIVLMPCATSFSFNWNLPFGVRVVVRKCRAISISLYVNRSENGHIFKQHNSHVALRYLPAGGDVKGSYCTAKWPRTLAFTNMSLRSSTPDQAALWLL
jgi:hypothetical protein